MLRTLTNNTPLLVTLLALVMFLAGGVASAYAQTLSVDFEETPLFLDADVKPGDSTDRTVTVSNSGGDTENVYMLAENVFNDGLADVMELVVSDGATTYFDGTFTSFFASGGVDLGSLAGGDSLTYTFTASLPLGTGNEYQLSSFGFDLRVGFVGGESETDSSDGPVGSSSSGGSALVISNVATSTLADSATITWNTNRAATSYVVCGDVADGPFTLTTEFPLYGYQFVIPEQTELTQQHSMTQTGLAAGTYECRPASRERTSDNFTIGTPVTFTIPEGIVAGEVAPTPLPTPSVVPAQPPGSVLGKGWKGAGLTYDEWRAELDREQAERERLEREELDDIAERVTDSDDGAPEADGPFGLRETSLWSSVRDTARDNPLAAGGVGALLLLALAYIARRYLASRSGV